MDIPYIRGRVAAQAHVSLPEGTVEEEFARNGFFGRYAHLYRTEAPVAWTRIEGPLRPRAFDLNEVHRAASTDVFTARTPVLSNADAVVYRVRLEAPMTHYARNADGDELYFVHEGAGRIETDFGPLVYEPGDYVLIPRGTTYRTVPTAPTTMLLIEAFSEIGLPDKGMLGQHALFDPAVIRVPTPVEMTTLEADARGEWEVRVRHRREITRVFYAKCPLNTVGWKGTLAVMQLNVRDIRPVLSDRYHLPPSAHTTFVMRNAVVCTFAPRPLENGDPDALKVPFYHSNIDFDEVIFYHRGEFFSRPFIKPGMMTFHPQGIAHGPQPGAQERSQKVQRTEEVAVMFDTKNPLDPTEHAESVELRHYWKSWQK